MVVCQFWYCTWCIFRKFKFREPPSAYVIAYFVLRPADLPSDCDFMSSDDMMYNINLEKNNAFLRDPHEDVDVS